jgi:argininosuccinate lyase
MKYWEEKEGSMNKKIWEGRINKTTDSRVEDFTCSIGIDRSLYVHDITGTAAYVMSLEKAGILDIEELNKIIAGLAEVRKGLEDGSIEAGGYEDIHSLVENELYRLIGEPALKIHTGRSRNDQIVLDEKLFCKDIIVVLLGKIFQLLAKLAEAADKEIDTAFPAYTHLQKAQPVSLAHYLLSFFEKFSRDFCRLKYDFESCDEMPLGAAACAGSGYSIDRDLLAGLLKFKKTAANSMDIAGSRDFIIDLVYTCSMIMLHLSRFCEDLIIYNSDEFSYIDIEESYCTGSSIMPQKKNPDILELIRGKSSIVTGNLVQLMILLKALPSTYNRDLQEDKKILFDAVGETAGSISMFTAILGKISFNRKRIRKKLESGFPEATDMADYLVKRGESFRNSHNITGKIIRQCIEKGENTGDLSLEELKKFSPLFSDDIFDKLRIESCIEARDVDCGTSKKHIAARLKKIKDLLKSYDKDIKAFQSRTSDLESIMQALQDDDWRNRDQKDGMEKDI